MMKEEVTCNICGREQPWFGRGSQTCSFCKIVLIVDTTATKKPDPTVNDNVKPLRSRRTDY